MLIWFVPTESEGGGGDAGAGIGMAIGFLWSGCKALIITLVYAIFWIVYLASTR